MEAMKLTLTIATAAHQLSAVLLASLAAKGFLTSAVIALAVAVLSGTVTLQALQFARAMTMVTFHPACTLTVLTFPRTGIVARLAGFLNLSRIATTVTHLCLNGNDSHKGYCYE